MTKFETLYRVYEISNEIRKLNGEQPVDLQQMKPKIENEAFKYSKTVIENSLKSIEKKFADLQYERELEAKTNAYYTTSQGKARKVEIKTSIDTKIHQWKTFEKEQIDKLRKVIKQELGEHWDVSRYDKGFAQISVIDYNKSTPEKTAYHFGQDIELRYAASRWLDQHDREEFKSSICSAGHFSVEGGDKPGERAMFYVGVGKLYGNPELVAFIKDNMKLTEAAVSKFSEELEKLSKILKDPLSGNHHNTRPQVKNPQPKNNRIKIK